ncbi:MAG: hypothetical protein KAW87_06350 [Candidatus Cloacimonetes bacterium]|nr:hypothetical protein [Candidatus Cloacimonadota bacterium]
MNYTPFPIPVRRTPARRTSSLAGEAIAGGNRDSPLDRGEFRKNPLSRGVRL